VDLNWCFLIAPYDVVHKGCLHWPYLVIVGISNPKHHATPCHVTRTFLYLGTTPLRTVYLLFTFRPIFRPMMVVVTWLQMRRRIQPRFQAIPTLLRQSSSSDILSNLTYYQVFLPSLRKQIRIRSSLQGHWPRFYSLLLQARSTSRYNRNNGRREKTTTSLLFINSWNCLPGRTRGN
jgi:hypothetical protein